MFKKLVFENDVSTPLNLKSALILRYITFAIILLAGCSVLYAGLNFQGVIVGKYFLLVIKAIILTAIHLSYLYLVFWLLIFSKPPEKLFWQQFIFPSLLGFAYMLNAFYIYFEWDSYNIKINALSIKVLSYILFILLYFLWFIRDLYEFKQKSENRKRTGFWFLVELFSIFILSAAVLSDLEIIRYKSEIFSKDWAVAVSLFFWILVTYLEYLGRETKYDSIYRDYLKENKILSPPSIQINPDIIKNIKNILDFGCADGSRCKEIMEWLNFDTIGASELTIYGYDKNKEWESYFKEKMIKYNPKFLSDKSIVIKNDYQLVILSHAFYDLDSVNQIVHILNCCKVGTLIIFRGSSPNSFFIPVSFSDSINLFSSSKSHLWYSFWLDIIKTESKLVRLHQKQDDIPDAIVQQIYSLNDVGIKSASKLLNFLYKGTLSCRSKEYLTALKKLGKVTEIPNEDLIYIFKKS